MQGLKKLGTDLERWIWSTLGILHTKYRVVDLPRDDTKLFHKNYSQANQTLSNHDLDCSSSHQLWPFLATLAPWWKWLRLWHVSVTQQWPPEPSAVIGWNFLSLMIPWPNTNKPPLLHHFHSSPLVRDTPSNLNEDPAGMFKIHPVFVFHRPSKATFKGNYCLIPANVLSKVFSLVLLSYMPKMMEVRKAHIRAFTDLVASWWNIDVLGIILFLTQDFVRINVPATIGGKASWNARQCDLI